MAVTAYFYSKAPLNAFKKLVNDLSSGSTVVKCALFTSSFTFNQETELYTSLANEVSSSGTGYTTGGVTLTSLSLTESSKVTTFTAASPSWSSSTISARYAVIYEAGSNVNLVCFDLGQVYTTTNGTFQLNIAAGGIFQVTVV